MTSYHTKKNKLNKLRPHINISNLQLYKLNKFKTNEYLEERFICFDGYYIIKDDKLIKMKIIDDEYINDKLSSNNNKLSNENNVLINNTSISLLTSKENCERYEETFKLPPEHEKITLTKKNYKTNKQSKHKLVVEIFNNNILDLYFLSEERFENHSLQEDIVSLLSTLI